MDIKRLLDDLIDAQPYRQDYYDLIVEKFETLERRLVEEEQRQVFEAAFANKLNEFGTVARFEFGTVARLVEEYTAYKVKARNAEAEVDRLREALTWISENAGWIGNRPDQEKAKAMWPFYIDAIKKRADDALLSTAAPEKE